MDKEKVHYPLVTKKKKLDDDRKWIALGLKRRVQQADFDKIVGMVTRRGESTFLKTKKKLEDKFASFQKKKESAERPRSKAQGKDKS